LKKSVLTLLALGFLVSSVAPGVAEEVKKESDEIVELEEVVVTGTREKAKLKEVPASIGVVNKEEMKAVKPRHTADVLNRIPGVYINNLGSETHTTGIRQPTSGSPVYLFMEDGIPIRTTGIFNHNSMAEINIPGVERVEVVKGPASSLYGSSAMGGVINFMTRKPPLAPETEISMEGSEQGYWRTTVSGGHTVGNTGYRVDASNVTMRDNWRDYADWDKRSLTMRIDRYLSDTSTLKTVLSYSNLDFDMMGTIYERDYQSRPWYSENMFSWRRMEAIRLSFAWDKEWTSKDSTSATLYLRRNDHEQIPSYTVLFNKAYYQAGASATGSGTKNDSEFTTLGLALRQKKDFDFFKTRVLVGLDAELSPSHYAESRLTITRNLTTGKYTSYRRSGQEGYSLDYDVMIRNIAPYAQVEIEPVKDLRFIVGVRYDTIEYDYDNNLSVRTTTTGGKIRLSDRRNTFEHLTPKVGLNYLVAKNVNVYANYSQGFAPPEVSATFKGDAAGDLMEQTADNYEIGMRGEFFNKRVTIDLAGYLIKMQDEFVSYNPGGGAPSYTSNAGESESRGIEVGLGLKPLDWVSFNVAYSYAVHEFDRYRISTTTNYNGKDKPAAPRHSSNIVLGVKPPFLKGFDIELERAYQGEYWLDNANTAEYNGHTLWNLRSSYNWKDLTVWVHCLNMLDKQYAFSSSKSGSDPAKYTAGDPKTIFVGFTYKF